MTKNKVKIEPNSPLGKLYTVYGRLGGTCLAEENPYTLARKMLIYLPFMWLFSTKDERISPFMWLLSGLVIILGVYFLCK